MLSSLGVGGMGEVYRARDAKLNRDVAIKVLLPAVANDPDRLARFSREAQVLASLNHSNIAHIHGLEESGGVTALVLELVEGEDLAQRIARGPIPLDEALPIARQIAEALEAAHDHGIIHRDLKPANIKVRADGAVKVLDFGLAKALAPAGASATADAMNSPTLSIHATEAGIILGTAAYMSPEQARGKAVDKRSDIWSLGCVLFEMLTGKRMFVGDNATDTIVAVVTNDPDWHALPGSVPPGIRRLLRRSLEKDPRRRLDSAAAVRIEIDDALSPSNETNPSNVTSRSTLLPWAVAATLGIGLAISIAYLLRAVPATTAPVEPPIHLLLSEQVPAWTAGSERSFAISPDGRRIVYAAITAGSPQLYLRDMRSVEATPIAGTENALSPFFSPDGQRIGFFADGRILVLALGGGAPLVLANAANARGATWAPDDTIIYSPATDAGLWQVPAAGGTPRLLAQPDSTKGERSYRWPELLPGGDAVMFTVAMSDILSFDDARIVVRSLLTGEQHEVLRGGSFATYAASGELLYAQAGTLLAVPFDVTQQKVNGVPRPVLNGIVTYPLSGAAQYALSSNGTLLYVAGKSESRMAGLSWVERSGKTSPLAVPQAAYQSLTLSPDGSRAAIDIDGANANIWILDLDRSAMTRLTLEWSNNSPTWTPDGARVGFTSARGGMRSLFSQSVDNQGGQEPVFPLGQFTAQVGGSSWLPDGQAVIFDAASPGTGRDLWIVQLEGQRVPKPLLQTSFNESTPAMSPDGRWLAYVSNDTGRSEVYLQPYPGPGGKSRMSADGGSLPAWARDGRELFFRSGAAVMSVAISPSPKFSAGQPRMLFQARSAGGYSVGRDGRFLMIENMLATTTARPVTVVLNWLEELKSVVQQ
ncbi:MAG: protein kinase [Acidobacteriota bacterium]|nr:protein kinase [Acidobacteriota bacterium]